MPLCIGCRMVMSAAYVLATLRRLAGQIEMVLSSAAVLLFAWVALGAAAGERLYLTDLYRVFSKQNVNLVRIRWQSCPAGPFASQLWETA